MPNLTSVGVTAGVPTSGTGTVSTIDNMVTLFPTLAAVTATGNAMDINVKSGGNPNGSALSSASAPVVIASDQGAVKVNIAQVNGATVPVGSGVQATAERVTLATDSPGIITIGTAGAASTQVVSVQGIASMTPVEANLRLAGTVVTAGAGATAAGTPRITLASDSPGIIATGSQASPASSYISSVVAGDIASAVSDTGNPVKIGGLAKTANPTAVADGQRVSQLYDKLGKAITVGAIRVLKGTQKTTISASTAETTIATAVAATFLDLYGLVLSNTGSTTTKVDIRDTTGGSIITTIEVPATDTRGFMLPVDSAIGQTTVNTNWTAQCAASTTAMEVTALFVKNL